MSAERKVAQEAAEWGLQKVGGRPPLVDYIKDLIRRRQFITAFARFKIQAENQRNQLGTGWVVIKPLLSAGVFGLVFGVLMRSRESTPHFIAFLLIGVFMFEFFSSSLGAGAKSISSNAALVQSLSFPRMTLPVSVVTQKFMQLIPAMGVMLLILIGMGSRPRLEWLLLIPVVAMFYMFNIGLVLIVARITVHLRDFANLLPFIIRFFFFTTGVFFSLELRFASHPEFLKWLNFQPIHVFLSLSRSLLLDTPADFEGPPIFDVNPWYWLIAFVWSVVVLVLGTLFFWAAEERYGRVD
jgi:teichoic acid transport system permease protein